MSREESIRVRSPFDGKELGRVPIASAADVDQAVTAAGRAFAELGLALTPFDRSQMLMALHERLSTEREDFAQLITAETGKVIRESRAEMERALFTLQFAAEEAKRIHGRVLSCDVTPRRTGRVAHVYRVPRGVVGAVTPFNFPINLLMHKLAPALAAGNAVVVKPSPQAPLSAERLIAVCREVGIPEGLVQLVQGGVETVLALVAHPGVQVISFTGSVAAGENIARHAGLKKLIMELGGNDPLIVWEDADLEQAARVAVEQGLGTCGQRCTAVKRVLVHRTLVERFQEGLVDRVRRLRVGDPSEPEVELGPMISVAAAERVETAVKDALERGAESLVGGERRGALLPPQVLGSVPTDAPLVVEETFGPVLPILPFDDLDDCVAKVNATIYGLQAGLFTERLEVMKQLHARLDVGTLVVNEGPGFRIDSLPFGGMKRSGLGREGVISAVEELTEEKTLIF